MTKEVLKQNILYSTKELQSDFHSFLNFIKSNKLTVILCWFFLLLSYGVKLFWYSISIDTECIINNYEGLKYGWFSINRAGLIFTKKILRLIPFNSYVANFLMLCTIFLFLMLLCFLFYYISKKFNIDSRCIFILPCVLITHPLFAEQFNFTLQTFEVSSAIALMFLAIFLITKWILDSKNILHLFVGIIFLTWSFASYQAVIFLYISVALAIYLFIYTNNLKNRKFESSFFKKAAIKYLTSFGASYLIYVAVSKLIHFVFKLKSEYTDNMICWGKDTFIHNIKYILSYVKLTLIGGNVFYSKVFAVVTLIALLWFLKFLFRKNHTNRVLYCFSFLALIASPYYLSFVLARPLIPRMQFSYQFTMAALLFFLIQQLDKEKFKYRLIKTIATIFSLYLSFIQGYKTSGLLYTDYMKYQCEVSLASKISERIDSLDIKDVPIVFTGKLHPSTPCEIHGEVIDLSFFEADSALAFGVSNRILNFMKTIGYSYKNPTKEDCKKAIEIAKAMESWPSPKAVKCEDGIIVVKLSEEV